MKMATFSAQVLGRVLESQPMLYQFEQSHDFQMHFQMHMATFVYKQGKRAFWKDKTVKRVLLWNTSNKRHFDKNIWTEN